MLFPSDSILNTANTANSEEAEASQGEGEASNERLLQLTLSSIEAGTWHWDILKNRLTWSDRLGELLGYRPGEVTPSLQAWYDRIHPEDLEETHQVLWRALDNHGLGQVEYRVIHADGSVHWLLVKGQGFYDSSDRPVRMLGIAMEITKRKQAELALKKQIEQEYLLNEIAQEIRRSLQVDEVLSIAVHRVRAFLEADRVIIFRFHPDGQGDVIMESVGKPWSAILSTTIFDPCFHDRYIEAYRQGHIGMMTNIDAPGVTPCYVQLLQQFEVKANLVVPILQNERLWGLLIVHQCAAPREWQPAEVAAVQRLSTQLAIALKQAELYQQLQLELQERQQSEQKIREQAALLDRAHQLLRLFIRYAPVGIAMFNREMQYVAASQRWIDEYALGSIESILNRCHYDIFPEIPERWKQIHQRCLAGAIEKCDEDIFVREDGTTQWISWEVHPWYQADQEIGGIIIFSIDVSSLKQSQQDLQVSQQQIQRQLAEIEAIYQSAPIGLNVLDRNLRFVRINERLAEINGLSVEEHLGRSVREVLPDLVGAAEQLLQTIIETGEPLMNVEIRGKTPAQPGVERIWLESFLPLKEGDQVIGISTVCEEITERKRLSSQSEI
ncbi:MAG: PAS domain S-box protein [Prochlorotrichaceae cyanobacterium]